MTEKRVRNSSGNSSLVDNISQTLQSMHWNVTLVSFCAAGEYNANYHVRAGESQFLFRINKGSQRNDPHQIAYEYAVLSLLANSGHTPRPGILFCPWNENSSNLFSKEEDYHFAKELFPRGFMTMEYINGSRFDYKRSYTDAARALAHIHVNSPPQELCNTLDKQNDPICALLDESEFYLSQYPEHPKKKEEALLRSYIHKVREKTIEYPDISHCIVNTELNSGNIISAPNRIVIVDWEKAVYSFPFQDLAHFLIPTTTLWKSNFTFTPTQEETFYKSYLDIYPISTLVNLRNIVAVFKTAVIARALSWCYTTWYEYALQQETERNSMQTMENYLDKAEIFLDQI